MTETVTAEHIPVGNISQKLAAAFSAISRFSAAPQQGDRQIVIQALPMITSSLTTDFPQAATLLTMLTQIEEPEVRTAAFETIEANGNLIIEQIKPGNPNAYAAISVINGLVEHGDMDQQAAGKTIFESTLPAFAATIDSLENPGFILDYLLEYGKPQETGIAKEKIRSLLRGLKSLERLVGGDMIDGKQIDGTHPIAQLLDSKKSKAFIETLGVVNEHLQQYGLSGYELMGIWRQASLPYEYSFYVIGNIAAINDLEQSRPHAAITLLKENNIANFVRYPPALLLDQFTDESDLRQEALMVVTRADQGRYHAAFSNIYSYLVYEKLHRETKQEFHIRLVEPGADKNEFKRLVSGDGKIGVADFALIEIHGSKLAFLLGKDDSDKNVRLTAADFRNDPTHLGLNRIKPGGLVLLGSCETGYLSESTSEEPGLAQQLAAITGLTVVGPQEIAGLKDIEITIDDHGITDMKPSYVAGNAPDGVLVTAHKYDENGVVY